MILCNPCGRAVTAHLGTALSFLLTAYYVRVRHDNIVIGTEASIFILLICLYVVACNQFLHGRLISAARHIQMVEQILLFWECNFTCAGEAADIGIQGFRSDLKAGIPHGQPGDETISGREDAGGDKQAVSLPCRCNISRRPPLRIISQGVDIMRKRRTTAGFHLLGDNDISGLG